MTEFTVTLQKALGISEKERRRRLYQAYEILFSAARSARERQNAENDQQRGSAPDVE